MKYLGENALSHLKTLISNALNLKADKNHTHTKSELTDYEDYELPTASADTLGGVKVGAGLAINNGVLSATGGGTADSVDWSNVQNAPTSVSEFTNDAGYLTAIPSEYINETELAAAIANKANASDIPTKVSDLNNDANYVESSDLVELSDSEIDTIWNA